MSRRLYSVQSIRFIVTLYRVSFHPPLPSFFFWIIEVPRWTTPLFTFYPSLIT